MSARAGGGPVVTCFPQPDVFLSIAGWLTPIVLGGADLPLNVSRNVSLNSMSLTKANAAIRINVDW